MTTETPGAPDPSVTQAVTVDPPAPPAVPTADDRVTALEAQLAAISDALATEVPEKFRALIPTALPVADRVKWLQDAKKSGLFGPAAVPATDNAKVRLTPGPDALAQMPAVARISAGYQ